MSFTVDYPAPIGRMTSPVFTYSRKVLELCEEIFADRAVSKDEKGASSAADELLKFKKVVGYGRNHGRRIQSPKGTAAQSVN